MTMRMFVGLCAALAFAVGSTAVHAVKIVANTGDDPTADAALGSVTYAAETLLMGEDNMTPASDEDDETAYYNIGGDDLFISAPADVAATAGDIYVVAFTLEGMVFQDPVAAADLTGGAFSLAGSVAAGDKAAVFRLSSGAVLANANLQLEANFAISAAGSGTIVRTVTNQTLASLNIPGVSGTMTHTGTGIIKVAAALDEKAVPMNPIAEVAESFKMFVGDRTTASVGTFMVGFKPMHREASGNDAGEDVDMLDEIILTGNDDSTPPKPNSTVRFMGDFSFASKVFTHGDADCGAVTGDDHLITEGTTDDETAAAADGLLMRDDDEMVTDTTMTMAVDVADADDGFGTPRHLCIMVQGEDTDEMDAPRILMSTTAYMAMGSYKGIEDAAIGPMAGDDNALGMIMRNGATVQVPVLMLGEDRLHRITMTNRGGADGDYTITFGDDTADPEELTGTLGAMSTIELNMGNEVSIDGSRTSATVIIEAVAGNIDVTSQIQQRGTWDTDTIVH